MILKKLSLCFCLALSISFGWTQGQWNWNQQHYFGDTITEKGGIWMSADYGIFSNNLTNQLVRQAIFDGKITPDATEHLDDLDPEKYTRFSAGTEGALWLRSNRPGNWRFLFGMGYNDQLLSVMSNGLIQLYLRGNGPYEDQTMYLGPSQLTYNSYQYAGFGFERQGSAITWGVTTQLIKASRYTSMVSNGELYTAPYGTEIDAEVYMRYHATNTSQNKLGAWYGTGYSINAYFQNQPTDNGAFVSVELRDFGQVFYEGVNSLTIDDSFNFQGVEANNILQLDDSLINGGGIDDLETVLGLKSSHPFRRQTLPAYLRVNYVKPLGDRASLRFGLKQYLYFGIPQVNIGLAYRVKSWFVLEPTIRAGGFSRFDIGLSAAFQIKKRLQIILKSEQFENLIVPNVSRGQYLFLGGQLKF